MNELTPEMISTILSDPNSDIRKELDERVRRIEAGESRTYTSDEVEKMLERSGEA